MNNEQLLVEAAPKSHASLVDAHTILLVDDEPKVLKSLQRVFIDDNYSILTAENGETALQLLETNVVQLIISDYRMPGMQGTELLKIIRDKYPNTIRIMLTAHSDTAVITSAINEGWVYKFINKPWNSEELRLTVNMALAQYDLIRENLKLKQINNQQSNEISKLKKHDRIDHTTLGKILLEKNIVLPGQLDMVKKYQKQNNITLVKALVDLGMVEESVLLKVIQDFSKTDFVSLEQMHIDRECASLIPRATCEQGCFLPIKMENKNLYVAMADPLDLEKIEYIRFVTRANVVALLARLVDIEWGIKYLYEGLEAVSEISFATDADRDDDDEIDILLDEEEVDTTEQLLAKSTTPPAIKMVNIIISEAIKAAASDIHVEPKTTHTLIRYRIDGILREKMKIPQHLHLSTVSRLKILAKMDIAERRMPQDGRITVKANDRLIDIRVSSMPTINGEKVVMRLLDKTASVISIDKIGLKGKSLERVNTMLNVPNGIIIATGPTGSGKTTSLYSMINHRLDDSLNFITIEDPVEYSLEKATQVQIRSKIGLTFASTLRSALRQDPDVVLVGEIRDLDTAMVAFQASMTGHLVFTTLHTNGTVPTISRLFHLGVEPYLVASAVQGIFAQRLVRRVCPHCKQLKDYDKNIISLLGFDISKLPPQLYYGAGCDKCDHTGYLGRTGIFEVFQMNEEFRSFLTDNYQETKLLNMAKTLGMETLLEDGFNKMLDGLTTPEELLRVLGPTIEHDYNCQKCNAKLDIKFMACPYCGTVQKQLCPECRAHVEPGWKACPYCGHTL
jgi:type II secretory ATPase GspE/PulE/Tfp pilus assembly ATPase PilB-like protein/CheY-like chemotaxis protein